MIKYNFIRARLFRKVIKLSMVMTLLFICQYVYANIRLPEVLSSNMVLQQKSGVNIWGWADPGEKVLITTSWDGKKDSVVTDGNGKWKIIVQTPGAGGPYSVSLKGNNQINLENVMIGEVWVCSGQSNMEMNFYWGLPQMNEDFEDANNSNIRFFHIPKSTALLPQERSEGRWEVSDSNNVKSFSAVAWYFGKRLQKELGVPIGLIHASWGGTPAEAWTPAHVIESVQDLKDAAKRLGSSNHWPVQPGLAYNSMIAPLTSFVIGGAIWYQGESNTGTASTYHQLFSNMILGWRAQWKKDFPFLYVQLAPYSYGRRNEGALLREAQEKTLSVPKTGMVVTTDIGGDTTDIHPRNKRDVGYRLAGIALSDVYGKALDSKSIRFHEMKISGQKIILKFTPGQQPVQKGRSVLGFQVAGKDQVFLEAIAQVVGNEIHVWHDLVTEPVAVRYAFSNTALGNIAGKNGLPLAPFRTDNWKVDTSPVKK